MSAPKLPSPIEKVVNQDDLINAPWYQYFLGADHAWRCRVNQITTGTTTAIVRNKEISVIASSGAFSYTLERPEPGSRATVILSIGSTHAGPVLVSATSDVAIGPSGGNALSFPTSASTYELVELVGVSTLQYYITSQTANVTVTASA